MYFFVCDQMKCANSYIHQTIIPQNHTNEWQSYE